MHLKVVDYVGNVGGGARFTAELITALMKRRPELHIEVVSYGPALDNYRQTLAGLAGRIRLISLRPGRIWRNRLFWLWSKRGGRSLKRMLGLGADWQIEVPEAALQECDVVWLPWAHWHEIDQIALHNVIASVHDMIFFQLPDMFKNVPQQAMVREAQNLRSIIASRGRTVVSSNATAAAIREHLSVTVNNIRIIPLSGEHTGLAEARALPAGWSWAKEPFLICPANNSRHKNHEVLLAGIAEWGRRWPLVLTGSGTDFSGINQRGARAVDLRRAASDGGFVPGQSLIGLGYIEDRDYFGLLQRAHALVMPTLAEGGGSFPVYEALLQGVPVICSDIPVMREQIERLGAQVLWFDPRSPSDLARQLRQLETDYNHYRAGAQAQVGQLHRRTWKDVADDYWDEFTAVAGQG